MSRVVLDSSILIASVFVERLTPQAQALIQGLQADEDSFHAPTLLSYELIAVVRKAVYQERVTPEEGLKAREQLLTYPIALYFDEGLIKRAYELATLYQRPTAYDAQYLALAERLACPFWTADERLFNALHPRFAWIRCLGR